MGEQGEHPLLSPDLYYVKKNQDFLTMVMFFPKEFFFFTSLSYPNFLTFSLLFSLGPCPNGLITCSSYSPRNVTRYTRTGVKP